MRYIQVISIGVNNQEVSIDGASCVFIEYKYCDHSYGACYGFKEGLSCNFQGLFHKCGHCCIHIAL